MNESRLARSLVTLVLGVGVATAASAQVPRFEGVGDLPGGAVASAALGISADGHVVVGQSEGASGPEAFRWTSGGGITGLGFASGANPWSIARSVSANGGVIAGTSRDGSGVKRAYRYVGSTLTLLANQSCSSCDPVTEGQGVSADGLVVVGSSAARSGGSAPVHLDPVRWPGGGTGISNLGNLSGGEEVGEAFGVSADGGVIAGNHMTGNGKEAFFWSGSGLNVLPTLTGGSVIAASALAVSADGSVIVGYTNQGTITLPGGTVVATALQAVRWSGPGFATLTSLGALPGAQSTDSRALAVSADGALIVGRAVDGTLSDRAFLWDATNGMRDLKTVLVDDYGLDLTGWLLTEATGISDVVGDAFTIVGNAIDPAGQPQGFVASLITPACSDGMNNDGDTFTDFPADPGCGGPADWSEEPDCSDGLDDDGDGFVDHPADPGCQSALDPSERPDCQDGLDNDGDGLFDHPSDPGCAAPTSPVEDPACSDGLDNDGDLAIDHPADPQCVSPADASETPDCADGLDNDGDGLIDHPADPECSAGSDLSESGQCSDTLDNDGDGRIDYPAQYPGCESAADPIEAPACSDGLDNDGDGQIDFPADGQCRSAEAESEAPVWLLPGDLIAVDRTARAVFRVDRTSGVQTLISRAALLEAPQGIAVRQHRLVVADPAGLVELSSTGSGAQRLASPPLDANASLQVVFDAAGDALVLEATAVSKVTWDPNGPGTPTTWMAMPTPEPLPIIGLWDGDAMAIEPDGDLVVAGLSLYGDGLFRVDAVTQGATILSPGFAGVRWLDLALEDDGTLVAVGFDFNPATQGDAATGVFRIDPVTGVASVLNDTHGWQQPTGVAVAESGDIYVAEAGLCADGLCSGGEIVHVDPQTGAATPLSSGGFIAGEMDLVVVPEPGGPGALLAGLVALRWLWRKRCARRT